MSAVVSRGKLILLRHVLSSMEIHMPSVLQVPKTDIKKIKWDVCYFFLVRAEWERKEEVTFVEKNVRSSRGAGYWRA